MQIVAWRSALSMVFTLVVIWRMRLRGDEAATFFGRRENYPKLLSRGVSGATAMTLYYFSLQNLNLGDAVTIFFTNVATTAVASVLFGYERLSWLMAAGVSACLGACPATLERVPAPPRSPAGAYACSQ